MKAFGFEITFAEVERFFKSWISRLSLFCIFVLCAIMAFGPDSLVSRLQLAGLRNRLGIWLGILFVFSFFFLIVPPIRDRIINHRRSQLFKGKDADARINQLSPIALGYLCEMYLSPDYAGRFEFTDPSFLALRDGKMVRAAQVGNMYQFPCYLQPWVVRWLDAHPDLVDDYRKQVERDRNEDL